MIYDAPVTPEQCGYSPTSSLVETWRKGQARQIWRLGPRVISLQLEKPLGGGIWKAVERMPMNEPLPQLRALGMVGVNHPSSWADTYHQIAPMTLRIKHTYNGMFSWWHGGPWSEAIRTGTFRGVWFRYDLVSAYRWAATLGLPNPSSYQVTTKPRVNGVLLPGLWLAQIKGNRSHLPSAYRTDKLVVVSTEDCETYNLDVEIFRGITWDDVLPSDYVEDSLGRLPFPKEAGRAYWGRWIAKDPLVCQTKKREWELKNIYAHFVWGWLIVHRVRSRVWQAAGKAAHVYVDEVVIPHELETGSDIGAWHLKEMYPNGLTVKRTGWYGAAHTMRATMRTGVS